MRKNYQNLINILGETRIVLNEKLAKYSSFRIGGTADLFFRANTLDDLITGVKAAYNSKVPFFIIGGGTNLLISDKGFRGLIIKNDTGGIKFAGARGKKQEKNNSNLARIHTVYLEVESGVGMNRLVRYTLDQGFEGLEAFLGQPGTVGGAVWINAHNMQEKIYFGDVLVSAKLLTKKGEVKNIPSKYFDFDYDYSILQKTEEIVLSVILKLEVGDKSKLWKIAQKVLDYRQKTQPTGIFSSGCTFRNIRKSEAIRLATPDFTTSSGFLLESVGLKGYELGSAQFSETHANFIINKREASSSDVLKLISLAKIKVKQIYGVDLKEEIVLVGEF